MKYYGKSGKIYKLEEYPFKGGGEGDVYNLIGIRDKCAKIYHSNLSLKENEEKIKVMVENPPNSAVLSQIAWPLELLYSDRGDFAGFIMPKIDVSDELIGVYEFPPEKYKDLSFNQKLIIAQNICAVINGVHDAGFVFGDFNPNNIGVDMKTGMVAFWDTDSYHIKDKKNGITYRCKVCLDGYVAPELLMKCKKNNPITGKKYNYENAPLETFTQETDRFALAIHIFKLLMNGYTPFGGIIANQPLDSTLAPGNGNEAIEKDQYCFKPGNTHLSNAVPDKNTLPKEIYMLFDKAFIDGRIDSSKRPTAREWYMALQIYENNLVQCQNNPVHQYMIGLSKCPWCEIDKKFNLGIQRLHQKDFYAITDNQQKDFNLKNTENNKIKNKYSKKKYLFVELIIITIFFIFDIFYIKSKIKPRYSVIKNGYYYETMSENGKVISCYIVDGLGDGNGKIYSFDYKGQTVEPLKVRCDIDTTLYIRIVDSSGNEIYNDDIVCYAGKEKEIDVDFYSDKFSIEISSRDSNFNYSIGVNY